VVWLVPVFVKEQAAGRGTTAPASGETARRDAAGSATWSVLDFVRTDLRTERLAIA